MTFQKNIFWANNRFSNINTLFHKDNRLNIFPTNDMTLEQRLNTISRLIIYTSLILSFYQGNINFIIYGVICLVIICLWYKVSSKNEIKIPCPSSARIVKDNYKGYPKKLIKKQVVTPSSDNPFMNVMPDSYTKTPNCIAQVEDDQISYTEVQTDVNDKFNEGLFRDVSDIYGRTNSQRQFYTMPNTSIPNDQEQFADWLYKTPPTCKEGDGLSCEKNNNQNIQGNLSNFC